MLTKKIEIFPDKQRLRDFITTRPNLQEMPNEVLQTKTKDTKVTI